ncbi:MAG: hypothetical protein HFJ23_08410 [Clostridia bacterium]|nr:hypothetical protein [Clostridia bacterium]
MLQCLVGTPTGTAKTNTNDTIIVTAMATDQDANDTLTYTLWWGNSSGNLSKTNVTATGRSGQSVTLEKSGLSNDTRYWFKVVVSDSIDEDTSGEGNEKTYCKGNYCSGGHYESTTCTPCNGTGKITCTASGCVNGKVTKTCSGSFSSSKDTPPSSYGTCPRCGTSKRRIFRSVV